MRALGDRTKTCYQLAHECIHLLSPTGEATTTVLEEGLATHFSHFYIEKYLGETYGTSGAKNYDDAKEKVGILLAKNPGIIKDIRAKEPCIENITAKMILEQCPY